MDILELPQTDNLNRSEPSDTLVTYFVGPDMTEFKVSEKNLESSNQQTHLVTCTNLEESFTAKCSVSGSTAEIKKQVFLPELDPSAFQLFLHLASTNAWSAADLKELQVSHKMFYSLLAICRHFGITQALANLEQVGLPFTLSFNEFKESQEFLEMPRASLEAMLSCQEIPSIELNIFKSAAKWAVFQCEEKGLVPNGENIRQVLGRCLYEIRFPIMTSIQFCWDLGYKGEFPDDILTCEESLAVMKAMYEMRIRPSKITFDGVPFKIHSRTKTLALSVIEDYTIYDPPDDISISAETKQIWVRTDQKIALLGIEFIGRSSLNSQIACNQSVQIKKWENSCITFESELFQDEIIMNEDSRYRSAFCAPVIFEKTSDSSTWDDRYVIEFSVCALDQEIKRNVKKEVKVAEDGTKFRIRWDAEGSSSSDIFDPISALFFNYVF